MPRAGIDVIVPVCGAPEALARCLASLEQHVDAGLDRILLVVDGPQTQAVELVIAAAAARRSPPALTVLYQPERAGYPAAVQRGIEEGEASGRDVVLLNSDTVVAAGWLDGLAAAAASAPRVGTVTPFTNNGTLFVSTTTPLMSCSWSYSAWRVRNTSCRRVCGMQFSTG